MRHHFLNFLAICCAAAPLLLTACASRTGSVHYPAAWAPLEGTSNADGCPELSGTYSNIASGAFPPELGAAPGLSEIFARLRRGTGIESTAGAKPAWPEAADVTSVSLKQEGETLRVTFRTRSGEELPLLFRRYHFKWSYSQDELDRLFTCYPSATGSRLRFFAEPESHSTHIPYLYTERGGTVVFLLRSRDGCLVVQWRTDSLGISALVLGTHLSFDTVWWRYPQVAGRQ